MFLSNLQKVQSNVVEIPLSAPEYPAELKILFDAPKTLYALGDISLLRERKFCVVGSRRTPPNMLKSGSEIAGKLSAHFVLVTGTADGGDSAAIEGALAAGGKVICVLAGGFSSLPQGNLELLEKVLFNGLLLSPHPFETGVRAYSYEYRNKLLAYLSEGVLVLGAGEKSGSLITAKYAKEGKKPIFALPYPPNSASGCGCNALIKEGAYLTENANDIAQKYGMVEKERKQISLTPDEEKVYRALKNMLSAHASELATITQIPVYKLRGVLAALEVKGAIVSIGGNRYAII